MKALRTLIKLSRNKLDKIAVELGLFEEHKLELLKELQLIIEEVSAEKEFCESNYSFMLEKYLDRMYKKEAVINLQIKKLENYIEKKRELLREEYSELKKYEIVLQKKQNEEYLKIQKEEAKFLDSFAHSGSARVKSDF